MSAIPALSRRLLLTGAVGVPVRRSLASSSAAASVVGSGRSYYGAATSAAFAPSIERSPAPGANCSILSIGRHFSGRSGIVPRRTIATSTRRAMQGVLGDEIMSSLGGDFVGTDVSNAMEALATADAVCFDVDSTVIDEEGIDVLAASLGKGEEVAAWTLKAMEGDTKFEDALAARLSIIQPSRSDIEKCLHDTPLHTSPGVDRLIEALNLRGTDVYLISGGFRIMIEPVARQVCVARSNIVANTILFDEEGNYAGFDATEPTSADMGKPKAVRRIKEEHGYDTVVMVGDGATDMQAKPPADAFIGYGGVAVRDAVRDGACWFVTDFEDMITIVKNYGGSKLTS